jgi:hypothetical protein
MSDIPSSHERRSRWAAHQLHVVVGKTDASAGLRTCSTQKEVQRDAKSMLSETHCTEHTLHHHIATHIEK